MGRGFAGDAATKMDHRHEGLQPDDDFVNMCDAESGNQQPVIQQYFAAAYPFFARIVLGHGNNMPVTW
jgi:hypothetical protein